jgi:hypothetical protein
MERCRGGLAPWMTAIAANVTAGACGEVGRPARSAAAQLSLVPSSAGAEAAEVMTRASPNDADSVSVTQLRCLLDDLGGKLDELERRRAAVPLSSVISGR